jgi:hypothetical protein
VENVNELLCTIMEEAKTVALDKIPAAIFKVLMPIATPVPHGNEAAGTHLRIGSGWDRLGHINQGARM